MVCTGTRCCSSLKSLSITLLQVIEQLCCGGAGVHLLCNTLQTVVKIIQKLSVFSAEK